MFKTPQEAIAAFEAESARSWEEYLKVNNLDPAQAPEACEAAKAVFRAGFVSGARFVSGALVEKLMAHGKTHIIQPDNPPTA